jgi:hypothetical protein
VGRVNETIACNMNIVLFHNLSDVENVHQQCDNVVSNEMNLQIMELQTLLWKPHNMMYTCWNLFVVNNNLHVDLVNLQMLRYIICQT